MRTVFRHGRTEIELIHGGAVPKGRRVLRFSSKRDAQAFLHPFLRDSINMGVARRVLHGGGMLSGLGRMADQEVVRHLASAVMHGRLKVVVRSLPPRFRRAGTFSAPQAEDPSPAATPVPPQSAPVEKTWVAIELVDEDGRPVAGEEYWIRTATGRAITGRLNKDGRAEVRGVDPGSCKITFPNLDANDWTPA